MRHRSKPVETKPRLEKLPFGIEPDPGGGEGLSKLKGGQEWITKIGANKIPTHKVRGGQSDLQSPPFLDDRIALPRQMIGTNRPMRRSRASSRSLLGEA